ncbi:MAG: VWA domain-containing protein, partial [Corynebacterium flavescens]|uniref:vWA domain-containing protein n=1 Tax=Corynebacterium flavescens TaxID=28028 RepID=UPI0026496DAE
QSSCAAPTPQAQQVSKATALDTLVLIDTSEAMAPGFESVSAALSGTAQTLGTDGKSVALWNYSSPLSPGATVGYRDNLGFGDGNAVAGTLERFGTGGVPQTRSAVLAALDSASQRSAESGQDTRVLVVTTGTQQDMDDASFRDALASRKGDSVKLSVVTIGGEKDALLGELADSHAEVTDANDSAALNKALAQATGV